MIFKLQTIKNVSTYDKTAVMHLCSMFAEIGFDCRDLSQNIQ